jgi:hypothetical protein
MGQAVLTILYRVELVCRDRLCLKCNDTRAETKFRLSAKRTTSFKSAGASLKICWAICATLLCITDYLRNKEE